ncbi:MAG: glycosyltransferase family 4 protein [Anaerolineales bacterium]
MRIALIAPGFIPSQTANSIQVMKMAQALAAEGYRVHVFTPGTEEKISWKDLEAHYGLAHRFKVTRLPARPLLRRYDFAFTALRAARAWGAELIYTRLPQAATLAAWRGWPSVFELHDMPSGIMGPWLLRRFLRAKGARRVVVNTHYLAGQLKQQYRLPSLNDILLVAPNGVDLQRYVKLPSPKSARKKLELTEAFTAGYSGHLYKGRGIGLILALAQHLPKMRFLLVGGRPVDVAYWKGKASGLKNVQFTGFIPNAELPLYQAACEVLLIPYSQRVAGSSGINIAPYTNPLKMFEYLAAGRPIVASDLPILREILSEQNAVILRGAQVQTWVTALASLQRSPRWRAALAKAARQTAADHSWEKRARMLLRGLPASR